MREEQRWRPCDGKVAARWAAHTAHSPPAAKCASHVALYLVRRNHHSPPQQSSLSLSTWPPICGVLHLAAPLRVIRHSLLYHTHCPLHSLTTSSPTTPTPTAAAFLTSTCDPFVLLCELVLFEKESREKSTKRWQSR